MKRLIRRAEEQELWHAYDPETGENAEGTYEQVNQAVRAWISCGSDPKKIEVKTKKPTPHGEVDIHERGHYYDSLPIVNKNDIQNDEWYIAFDNDTMEVAEGQGKSIKQVIKNWQKYGTPPEQIVIKKKL